MKRIDRAWNRVILTAVLTTVVAGALFLSGCGAASNVDQHGVSPEVQDVGTATQRIASDMSEEEQLLFMREEEKLARDVYLVLYEKWGIAEFNTIAGSEVRHMASVKNLLDRYGLEDPVGADTPGVFVNQELQAAYDDLVAKGSQSVVDAIEVGVTIEQLDIEDLQTLIDSTTKSDITQVAQNLLQGSQNHLASFTSLLAQYSE